MPRPLPRFPEPDTQDFWKAASEHRLTFQRCSSCSQVVFYPRRHCTHCGGADLAWETSAGQGAVYTFSVVALNRNPSFVDLVPYVVAWIDVDEGFRIMSNVVGVDDPFKDVHCGMRVKVRWEDQNDDVSLPLFEPA